MNYLIKISKKLSEKRYFSWLLILLFCSIFLIENPWFGQAYLEQITGGLRMIDMNLYNSASNIIQYLTDLGDAGRSVYLGILGLDFLLILMLTALLIVLIYRLLKRVDIHKRWFWLILLPLIRGFFDILETSAMAFNVISYPELFKIFVYTAVISTPVKWLFFMLTVLTLVILFLLNIRKNWSIK